MSGLRAQGGEMGFALDPHGPMPLYRQLYDRLRTQILAGQLESGARLPSTRTLATELGISRTTAVLAYEQLLAEGYIASRVGYGTHVVRLQSNSRGVPVPATPGMRSRRGRHPAATFPEASYASPAEPMSDLFRVGQPDITCFPHDVWARLVARHARRSIPTRPFYEDARGYAPLRAAIAAHVGVTRGIHCTPDQVIITAGAQGALHLLTHALLNPGDAAWVEDPGYGGARGALLAAGARLVGVPVDGEGIDVEAGRTQCPDARFAVVTPSHQFPTGGAMSLRRRLALLEWARDAAAWIVEDDYDSEVRYGGRPLEALQALDMDASVIYVGTFSKVLFPALRVGYLIAPPTVVEELTAARLFVDIHPPLLEQMALTDFIAEGYFVRHLRRMRGVYRGRRDVLVTALTEEMGGVVAVDPPDVGMHLVAWLPHGMDVDRVIAATAAAGLHILPVSRFAIHTPPREGLVLGFANSDVGRLRTGVCTLAHALRSASVRN